MLAAGAALGTSAVFASSAQAAAHNYVVNSTGDPSGCDGCLTLRQAINDANGDGQTGDTIIFDSSLSGLPIDLNSDAGELNVTAPGLTIDGKAAPGLSVSGQGNVRVFSTNGSSIAIDNLTITDGSSSGPGGAIRNEGSLTLTNDHITNSKTGTGDSTYDGGAIYTYAPLTIQGSTITGNIASHRGGAIAVQSDSGNYSVNITNSTISGNKAQQGGGIWSGGNSNNQLNATLTITDTQIAKNQATSGSGGGISASSNDVSITGSTISGNTASGSGGGVDTEYPYGTTISDSTLTNNTATFDGGGLESRAFTCNRCAPVAGRAPVNRAAAGSQALVENSTISNNQAKYGAGVEITDNSNGLPVTISGSTISGNTGSAGSAGGGIDIGDYTYFPIQLVDSTISGNSASRGGGVELGDGSGALFNGGGSFASDNSTIDGNSASRAGGGGGIYLPTYRGSTTITNPSLSSTIVAGNNASGAPNDLAQGQATQLDVALAPVGFDTAFDLIQNKGNATFKSKQSNILGKNPDLGALAKNGGPTETMLPSNTSPVIDEGNAATGLTTDQRGDPRTVNNGQPNPAGDRTDIGAVELARIPIFASIEPATGVKWYQAVIHGRINTNGRPVTWHFEFGTSTAYGHSTQSESISLGHGIVPAAFTLGLFRGTVFHYRLVAVSAAGQVVTTGDESFRTLSPSIHAHPGSVEPGKRIHLFGSTGGCPAGSTVTLLSWAFSHKHMVEGEPAVFTTTEANGHFSVVAKIPKHRAPGSYAMTGKCDGGGLWFPKAPRGHARDAGSAGLARMASSAGPAARPVLLRIGLKRS